MVMDPNFDLDIYMRILVMLFVAVAVIGGGIAAVLFRKQRQIEEAKAHTQSLGTWDVESPNSLSHR